MARDSRTAAIVPLPLVSPEVRIAQDAVPASVPEDPCVVATAPSCSGGPGFKFGPGERLS
jgi:hypothetical protein